MQPCKDVVHLLNVSSDDGPPLVDLEGGADAAHVKGTQQLQLHRREILARRQTRLRQPKLLLGCLLSYRLGVGTLRLDADDEVAKGARGERVERVLCKSSIFDLALATCADRRLLPPGRRGPATLDRVPGSGQARPGRVEPGSVGAPYNGD